MITKDKIQDFIDTHAHQIAEILPGGLKDERGKWLLVCPMMERFDLDFSKVKITEESEKPKTKTKRTKKK